MEKITVTVSQCDTLVTFVVLSICIYDIIHAKEFIFVYIYDHIYIDRTKKVTSVSQ
jgi:hypothetical protein